MFALPSARQSIWQLYQISFKFWKVGFKEYSPLMLICAVVAALPHFFIPELNTFHLHRTFELFKYRWLFSLFYTVFVVYAFIAILYRIDMILIEKEGHIGEALFVGLKKLPVVILSFLISIIAVLLGFALFVIPGLIVAILLSMYFVLIIVDNEGLITAFNHSCDLVRNNWWRTAIILLVPSILYWVIVWLLESHTVKVWIYKSFFSGGEIWVLHNLSRIVLNIIYFPWFCALMLLQLNDLKLRNVKPSSEQDS